MNHNRMPKRGESIDERDTPDPAEWMVDDASDQYATPGGGEEHMNESADSEESTDRWRDEDDTMDRDSEDTRERTPV